MDRTKETLAVLRTLLALFVVLDAPLGVWVVRHYADSSAGLMAVAVIVVMLLSAGIIGISVGILKMLGRLGDNP